MISSGKTSRRLLVLVIGLLVAWPSFAADSPRHRVIVSTDIGCSDPDDFQSMVHLLLYADELDIEGLISSPWGAGRKQDILDVIDLYEQDFANLQRHSDTYPTPEDAAGTPDQQRPTAGPITRRLSCRMKGILVQRPSAAGGKTTCVISLIE